MLFVLFGTKSLKLFFINAIIIALIIRLVNKVLDKKLVITNIKAVILYDTSTFHPHESYNPNLPFNELIYTLDGENSVKFAGQSATEKGDFIRYLPKGNYPNGSKYTLDIIKPGKCIDVYFDTNSDISKEMLIFDFNKNPSVRNMFTKMLKLWYAKHDGYYHKCMSHMYAVLSELEQTNTFYMPEKKYSVIKPAIEYIDNNFLSGDIDCSLLSDLCGVSYSYFKRLFIMKFNISPVKYITKKRISYACDLLVSNKYSVSDIASMTGYSDVYYFSRVFKENTGMSPLEYKKSLVF